MNGRAASELELEEKRVLVVGLAKTGLAVARFLQRRGARVTAADVKTEQALGSYGRDARALGIHLELGPHKEETFLGADLIVVSPGVPHDRGAVKAAAAAGVPVIGELELVARYVEEPIVAVTGTNGKTTTTSLIGAMLKYSNKKVFVGGNIGNPLIDLVDHPSRPDVVVAEISSFQLDTAASFRPNVGVLLNITEDHLDRYENFGAYVQSKARLFANQGSEDFAVLNLADPLVRQLAPAIRAVKLYFNGQAPSSFTPEEMGRLEETNRAQPLGGGAIRQGNGLICSRLGAGDRSEVSLSLAKFALAGEHNRQNAAAASLAALAMGATVSGVQDALDTFKGLRHRLEHAGTLNGVDYYDDSKATNVGAVGPAVETFDRPVILIMGGRDKGGSYDVLRPVLRAGVKKLIVTGEAADKILSALGGITPSARARDLEDAVHLAAEAASPGDVVLLAPGCSSFDMFTDYAHRGQVFCEVVSSLAGGESQGEWS